MLKFIKVPVFFLFVATILFNPVLSFSQENSPSLPDKTDFPIPRQLSLCEEPMPLNDQWVWEMLDREFTIAVWNEAQVFMWLKRAGRYFPYLEEMLTRENMPQDIKYVAIAESSLLPRIKSGKGAVGFWQFMPDTATHIGLRSDNRMDERCDFEESTAAALRYLKSLKGMFGSWTLAIAAYNCGEDRIRDAMREQRQTGFYNLRLPEETERYIFQIAAIKMIMENPGAYGYHVPGEKVYKPIQCDNVWVEVHGNIHITDFAQAIGTSLKAIRDLNPQITDNYLPVGSYSLKTPSGTGGGVPAAIRSLSVNSSHDSSDRPSPRTYVVKPGDTLSEIAQATGVSASQLKSINKLKGPAVRVGQVLHLE